MDQREQHSVPQNGYALCRHSPCARITVAVVRKVTVAVVHIYDRDRGGKYFTMAMRIFTVTTFHEVVAFHLTKVVAVGDLPWR